MATKFGIQKLQNVGTKKNPKMKLVDKNDNFAGTNLKDMLFGNGGKDKIDGKEGNDYISGGESDDMLTGGTGADTFTFEMGDGADIITDFSLTEDVLEIGGFSTIKTVADIVKPDVAKASTDGLDTIITLAPGQTITLKGIKLADFVKDVAGNVTFGS